MGIAGKERGEGLDQIGMPVAVKTAGHLLQGDNVRRRDAVGDPARIEFAIQPDAELDVVADELHDTL